MPDIDELFDALPEAEGDGVTLEEMKEGGNLFPRYYHFHANAQAGMLPFAPGKLNMLTSAYTNTMGYGTTPSDGFLRSYRQYVQHARFMFVDSGAISTLNRVKSGKGNTEQVLSWMERQEDVVKVAWDLHDNGAPLGVVGVLDLPAYEGLLSGTGITVQQAQELTFRNTMAFRHMQLPPGWKPVYMAQGQTEAEYVAFMRRLDELGVLNDIRAGTAWLAVGGTLDKKPPAIYTLYRAIRKELGEGHIHALGVSRLREVGYMASRNWIQSSDSSSAMQEIIYNRGRYAITGPRPAWLTMALWAAAMLHLDAQIARSIRQDEERGIVDQLEMFEEVASA